MSVPGPLGEERSTPVYSHSGLSSFEKCPKQFHYRYIEKLPAESESIEAFVGKRVHEVLERLHRFADSGRLPGIHKVLRRYQILWDELFDPTRIRIVRQGTPLEFYRRLGERCLENYYRRHYPFDEGKTLGLEAKIAFSLDAEGRYRIRGFIDRITRARDGAIEIQDYKTGRWIPKQDKLDEDRQLALYQLGLEPRFGRDSEYRLIWHFVASGQMRISRRSPEQLEQVRRETIERIDEIHAATDFPAKPSVLCGWCEYRERCPSAAPLPDAPPVRRRRPPAEAPLPMGQLSLL